MYVLLCNRCSAIRVIVGMSDDPSPSAVHRRADRAVAVRSDQSGACYVPRRVRRCRRRARQTRADCGIARVRALGHFVGSSTTVPNGDGHKPARSRHSLGRIEFGGKRLQIVDCSRRDYSSLRRCGRYQRVAPMHFAECRAIRKRNALDSDVRIVDRTTCDPAPGKRLCYRMFL